VGHQILNNKKMGSRTKRFITRVIVGLSLFVSLFLLDQINESKMKGLAPAINIMYILVFLAVINEAYIYFKKKSFT
jgi:hypothetical protein